MIVFLPLGFVNNFILLLFLFFTPVLVLCSLTYFLCVHWSQFQK